MKKSNDLKRVSIDLRGETLARFNDYMDSRRIKQTQACVELVEAGLNELSSRGMNGFLLTLETKRPADNGRPTDGDIVLAKSLNWLHYQNPKAYAALVMMIQALLSEQEQSNDFQAKDD